MKRFFLLTGLIFSHSVFAEHTIDIHGYRNRAYDQGILKHAKEITDNQALLFRLVSDEKNTTEKKKKLILEAYKDKCYLAESIRKKYGFIYVDFQSTMMAPNQFNTSIEIIDRTKPELFNYINPDPESDVQEVDPKGIFKKVSEYDEIGINLFMQGKLMQDKQCKAYHCLYGFANKELQPYKKIFEQVIKNEKNYIVDTLRTSKSTSRKENAIILMGFFPNPQEIISFLLPYINDNSPEIRNITLRVIGSTLLVANMQDVDPRPFIKLLESPQVSDRNKALFTLVSLAKSEKNTQVIVNEGGDMLIDILELKQKNNHDPAYLILKKISGKNYAEYDIASWRKWLKTSRS